MTPFYEILLSNLILDMLITFFLKRLKLKKAEQIKKESPLIIDPKENELNEKSIKLKNLKETFSSQIIEAEKLNAPRTFAQFSKMQRKNNILQDEISKLDEEISKIKQEITILEQPLLKEESNGDLLDQLEAKYFFNMKVLKYFLVMFFNILGYFLIYRKVNYGFKLNSNIIYPLNGWIGEQVDEVFQMEFSFVWIILILRYIDIVKKLINFNAKEEI